MMGVDEGGLFVSIASELCRLVKFGAFHGYAGWLSNFKKERKEGKKEGRKKKNRKYKSLYVWKFPTTD